MLCQLSYTPAGNRRVRRFGAVSSIGRTPIARAKRLAPYPKRLLRQTWVSANNKSYGRDSAEPPSRRRRAASPQTPLSPRRQARSDRAVERPPAADVGCLQARGRQGHPPRGDRDGGARGQIGWFDAIGQQDPAASAPMAHDSIFRIFSMTKPIVSVGIMMLRRGRPLRPRAIHVAKFIPEFADQKVGVESNGAARTSCRSSGR